MMNSKRIVATVGLCALLAMGCDESQSGADVSVTDITEVQEDLSGRSVYRMTVTQDDDEVVLDRELTGDNKYFAFGSTHIAPAVSFAMMDSVTFPRTMTINLNFGIIVGSEAHAVQTDSAGSYAFKTSPPAIEVSYRGLQYSSLQEGATGTIVVSEWAVSPGDAVAGTFRGTLVAQGPSGRTLDVQGLFHFTLPERQ